MSSSKSTYQPVNKQITHFCHPAATAAAATDFIPWCLKDDKALVCFVRSEGDKTVKEVMTLADLLCWITRERGVTEVRVIDHTLGAKMKAGLVVCYLQLINILLFWAPNQHEI